MCDVITCNPKDIYYPYFVERINKDRDLFGRVIVMMTQSSSDRDYSDYIENHLKDSIVIREYDDDGRDWRNAALNRAIKSARGDILFLEQDFISEDGFFEKLLSIKGYNAIGFRDGNRLHPACLWVKRDALYKTQRDFSVEKDVGDHFYKFTKELEIIGGIGELKDLELPKWKHLAGLTQNYRMTSAIYNQKEFDEYNKINMDLPQPESWRRFVEVL